MVNFVITEVPVSTIHLITKNDLHLPSKSSLKRLGSLNPSPHLTINLFKWNGELFYVDQFYEINLQKQIGPSEIKVFIYEAESRDQIIYLTLRNSYTNKQLTQKSNQFRFELIQELTNLDIENIKINTGLTDKHIKEFCFHEEMSRSGRIYAEKARDLTMMNKIWSSPTLIKKAKHIRPYLENMRRNQSLTTSQFILIEKYTRLTNKPFHHKKRVYETQINMLISEKEMNELILFKRVEHIGIFGKPPSAA